MRFHVIVAAAMLLPATSVAADEGQKVQVKDPQPKMRLGPPQHELKVISPVPEKCPSLAGHAARKRGESLAPDKLTELPPAEAFHAVYRVGPDGCLDPVMVGYQHRDER